MSRTCPRRPAVGELPADPDAADVVRGRGETVGVDRRVILDPHPEQVADRGRGLTRWKFQGVPDR
jgi:hypothetical protein